MRPACPLLVATLAVMAAAPPAWANWRDNCPVDPEFSDKKPAGKDADQHGVTPDIDSVFGGTRLVFASRGAAFSSRETSTRALPRTRMHTTIAHGSATLYRKTSFNLGGSLTLAHGIRASEPTRDADPDQMVDEIQSDFGSLVGSLHVRWSFLSRGWRNGIGFRIFGAAPRRGSLDQRILRGELAARSPLEPQLFAERSVGAAFERRYELRGCFAPFVHVNLAAMANAAHRAGDEELHWFLTGVTALSAGLHVTDYTSAYIQTGFELDLPRNAIKSSRIQRYRLGVEKNRVWRGLSIGGHLDLMVGSFDGVFAGLDLSYRFGGAPKP